MNDCDCPTLVPAPSGGKPYPRAPVCTARGPTRRRGGGRRFTGAPRGSMTGPGDSAGHGCVTVAQEIVGGPAALGDSAPEPGLDSAWVLTDGTIGMEVQCRGLAQALGVEPMVKRVTLRRPWRWLSPHVRMLDHLAIDPAGDAVAPPWPDLIIASGRRSVAPALMARRAARGRTLLVQIQTPGIGLDAFDLVVVPHHDDRQGPNVLETVGALHGVTPDRLAAAAAAAGPALTALPRPRVAVVLGGSNRVFRFSPAAAERLLAGLRDIVDRDGASLMVTASRRTDPTIVQRLRAGLADTPGWFWDGTGDNPYLAVLGLADAVVVTGDSVNMVSEAAATAKPVHVFQLDGGSAKFRRFHDRLSAAGVTRPFAGRLEHWRYQPLDDTRRVADAVRALVRRRRAGA